MLGTDVLLSREGVVEDVIRHGYAHGSRGCTVEDVVNTVILTALQTALYSFRCSAKTPGKPGVFLYLGILVRSGQAWSALVTPVTESVIDAQGGSPAVLSMERLELHKGDVSPQSDMPLTV